MHDPAYTRALPIFIHAAQDGRWDNTALPAWYVSGSLRDWEHLELAWQGGHNPDVFSWPVLREEVQTFARERGLPPLLVLGTFLYPGTSRLGYEGNWFDWQTDDVKTDIYKTAQQWLEQSTASLEKQSYTLLSLAIASCNMPLWRLAPKHCVEHMAWDKMLFCFNACPKKDLLTSDIERITKGAPERLRNGMDTLHLANCMVHCCTFNWRSIARHLETKEGPGLWLQYVLKGPRDEELTRRKQAWMNMQLGGLDAWSLVQWVRPSESFERSLQDIPNDSNVHQHLEWAHRWWLACTLGVGIEHALHLAHTVKTPVGLDDALELPATLLSMEY